MIAPAAGGARLRPAASRGRGRLRGRGAAAAAPAARPRSRAIRRATPRRGRPGRRRCRRRPCRAARPSPAYHASSCALIGAKRTLRALDGRVQARAAREAEAGHDLVLAPGEALEHRARVRRVLRLAQDAAVADHLGVGSQHRQRLAAGDRGAPSRARAARPWRRRPRPRAAPRPRARPSRGTALRARAGSGPAGARPTRGRAAAPRAASGGRA